MQWRIIIRCKSVTPFVYAWNIYISMYCKNDVLGAIKYMILFDWNSKKTDKDCVQICHQAPSTFTVITRGTKNNNYR